MVCGVGVDALAQLAEHLQVETKELGRLALSNVNSRANMTSLGPLRNSQRDFSLSVTLKYIMLQSRGLRMK